MKKILANMEVILTEADAFSTLLWARLRQLSKDVDRPVEQDARERLLEDISMTIESLEKGISRARRIDSALPDDSFESAEALCLQCKLSALETSYSEAHTVYSLLKEIIRS